MRRGYWPLYNARVSCDDSKQRSASLPGEGSVWRNAQVLLSREKEGEVRWRATQRIPLSYSSRGLPPDESPAQGGESNHKRQVARTMHASAAHKRPKGAVREETGVPSGGKKADGVPGPLH